MAAMSHGAGREGNGEPTPYVELDREAWAALGARFQQPLSTDEITRLRGLGDHLDLDEVQQVYLPLSKLLSLRVEAARQLHRAQEEFLHRPQPPRTAPRRKFGTIRKAPRARRTNRNSNTIPCRREARRSQADRSLC